MYTVDVELGIITFNGNQYTIPFNITVLNGETAIYSTTCTVLATPSQITRNYIRTAVHDDFVTKWNVFLSNNVLSVTTTINNNLSYLVDNLENVVN